ncbi:hypothetical protein Tco_0993348 [Tanacetum coccineum]|uniref:Uncharacterized protein n=1 Tax=Tanacetum coccineum TaxID=301880 RepID=A0ABQ5F5R1_9ASTR
MKYKPFEISINTKLLNFLQPEWSKYVTLTRQKFILEKEHYDVLYDYLSQLEPHIKASKAKKAARNHYLLSLVTNSHANSPYSHASPSYSRSPQPSYVTHHSSVIDYDDDYQGKIQGDKLSTAMIKNVGYAGSRNQETDEGNSQYTRECPKPRVHDAKYFKEQMLLATKDEAGVHLDDEENNFILMNAYGDDMLEELNASVIMMEDIQPADDKSDAELNYNTEVINEAVQEAEEVSTAEMRFEHDPNAHDQPYADIESLIYNVQVEAESQRKMNIELKNQKALLQRELEMFKQQKNEMLMNEKEKILNDSKDIKANLLKRIKKFENDFQRSQAQSIDFKLQLQHQKEKTACDISWKSKMTKLNGENVSLNIQIKSLVQERENIKFRYQKLFNSIKMTPVQHQWDVDELIENINQNTYGYGDVCSKNQDMLMIIFELKAKLKTTDKGKNINTKFDKSVTLKKLICVTPMNKNKDIKAKMVSKVEDKKDESKPVTSCSKPKNEQDNRKNANVIA